MGRKIKKQAAALAVLLTAIYIQQPMFQQIVQAKVTEETALPGDAKEPEETVPSGDVKEPDKEPDKEPEKEPEKPDEPIKMFSVKDSEPDGNNGYFITLPSVKIIHNDSRGSTVYRFINGDGEQTEEKMEGQSAERTISPEMFRDGMNTLEVWIEDEEGNMPENGKVSRTYQVDTQKPALSVRAPRGFDVWYQKEAAISVETQDGDKGSGVSYISCYSKDVQIGSYEADSGIFLIDFASSRGRPVNISIWAEDMAGNRTVEERQVFIDNTPPKAWMEGLVDYMITSEPVEAVFKISEDNALDTHNASILWKNVDGKETLLPSPEWADEAGTQVIKQTLEQDGIYSMEVTASDKAGYEARQKAQVIIDRNNPVISFTDRVDGAYLREFCWDYPITEIIKDFTTYTYEIKLDGQLYTLGERVTEEGAHYLRVRAQDAAGNSAFSAARFVIDRKPPEITFDGVKDGEVYEKEISFKIQLSDSEDMFEQIKINGKPQRLSKGTRVCHYNMQEPGEYRVEVKARDKAGNRNEKSILFAVVKERTILEKALSPVKKSLGMEKEIMNVSDIRKEKVKEEEKRGGGILAAGIITALAAAIAAVYKLLKK